jgi:hypothetical protein
MLAVGVQKTMKQAANPWWGLMEEMDTKHNTPNLKIICVFWALLYPSL